MMIKENTIGAAFTLLFFCIGTTSGFHHHFTSVKRVPTRLQRQQCRHDDDDNNVFKHPVFENENTNIQLSRRDWFKRSIVIAAGTTTYILANRANAAEDAVIDANNCNNDKNNNNTVVEEIKQPTAEISPINLTQVATENKVNVKLMCPPKDEKDTAASVVVDRKTFTKIKAVEDIPSWLPTWLRPKPQVLKTIPNTELLQAAIVAGSIVEVTQTTLLYPLSTIKARIQATEGKKRLIRRKLKIKRKPKLRIKRRIQDVGLSIKRQVEEGNLYAGIVPSLVVAVPSAGVYYGIRDVTKRVLSSALETTTKSDDVIIAVVGALIADIVTIVVRTPADLLATRLQVGLKNSNGENKEVEEIVGDWINDSIKRLPASILTDLPYLLTRIALNGFIARGDEDIVRYEIIFIFTACLCALLTTPFDVARTRILIDSNDDASDGIDGGSGEGLIRTMKTVMDESEGGIRNLFRGWFYRVVYLGIGRAWLGPINILGYSGIRDAVLLKWFD